MQQPRALLVDTNRGSYPLLRALDENGWHVTTIGSKPEDPLAALSHDYIQADYSVPGVLQEVVDPGAFQAIIPGCTDASYLACAALNHSNLHGIDDSETAQLIFNKKRLRELADQLHILQPAQLTAESAQGRPRVLIKPVDSYSGAGIQHLEYPSASEINTACQAAASMSRSGKALIEEMVIGQLYSHSCFISDQMIVDDFFIQEDCTDYPYAVDTSCLALNLDPRIQELVRSGISKIAQHLDLKDGLLHTQFIVQGRLPYLIEITRRHPGDLYGLLVQYSTGSNYSIMYLNGFLPSPIELPQKTENKPFVIRHTITAGLGGNFWGVSINTPLKVLQWVPLAVAGTHLKKAPQGRAAIAFIDPENAIQHKSIYSQLTDRSLYTLR